MHTDSMTTSLTRSGSLPPISRMAPEPMLLHRTYVTVSVRKIRKAAPQLASAFLLSQQVVSNHSCLCITFLSKSMLVTAELSHKAGSRTWS